MSSLSRNEAAQNCPFPCLFTLLNSHLKASLFVKLFPGNRTTHAKKLVTTFDVQPGELNRIKTKQKKQSQKMPQKDDIYPHCLDMTIYNHDLEDGVMTNQQMGVSKNKGTPKWMVYNGKFRGTPVPLFLETPKSCFCVLLLEKSY